MSSDKPTNVVFVADSFYEQGIHGGAEVCNKNLIELLESKYNWEFIKINSSFVDFAFIEQNKTKIFVIANFMLLDRKVINFLSSQKEIKYIVYEHDHKYVSTNDPSKFAEMLIPPEYVINREFYENALCVFVQSKLHGQIIEKNLLLTNIINLSGNVWSPKQIELLKQKRDKISTIQKKRNLYSILQSNNRNKGMYKSIKACEKNGWDYELIPPADYEQFLTQLLYIDKLLFTPEWVETFSRVCVEAKILDCTVITNKLVGCFSEQWVTNNTGQQLLEEVEKCSDRIADMFNEVLHLRIQDSFFLNSQIEKKNKISVITSIYKGKRYIEHFLNSLISQTYFRECEFIIAHAKSESQFEEEKQIMDFINSNNITNIRYFKFDYLPNVQESMNFMIEQSSGSIISIWNVDDNRKIDSLEKICKFFDLNEEREIVYHDCLQTAEENETFISNSSGGKLYEHSVSSYSSENMIKCLPGPMPSWKKTIHKKIGFFNEKYKYAGDWDFWLRCVRGGIKFSKIGPPMGLYYNNPHGLSTVSDIENRKNRFAEEQEIFINNIDIFGYANYSKYREYFNV
jgi:hypothetical protein